VRERSVLLANDLSIPGLSALLLNWTVSGPAEAPKSQVLSEAFGQYPFQHFTRHQEVSHSLCWASLFCLVLWFIYARLFTTIYLQLLKMSKFMSAAAHLVLRDDVGGAQLGQCEIGNQYNGHMGARVSSIFVILAGSLFGK
jgi:hypothetical protein